MSRFGVGKVDRLPGYFDRDEDTVPPGPQPGMEDPCYCYCHFDFGVGEHCGECKEAKE